MLGADLPNGPRRAYVDVSMPAAAAPSVFPIIEDVSHVFGTPTWLTSLVRMENTARLNWVGGRVRSERGATTGAATPGQLGFELSDVSRIWRSHAWGSHGLFDAPDASGDADFVLEAGDALDLTVAWSPQREPWSPHPDRTIRRSLTKEAATGGLSRTPRVIPLVTDISRALGHDAWLTDVAILPGAVFIGWLDLDAAHIRSEPLQTPWNTPLSKLSMSIESGAGSQPYHDAGWGGANGPGQDSPVRYGRFTFVTDLDSDATIVVEGMTDPPNRVVDPERMVRIPVPRNG